MRRKYDTEASLIPALDFVGGKSELEYFLKRLSIALEMEFLLLFFGRDSAGIKGIGSPINVMISKDKWAGLSVMRVVRASWKGDCIKYT